MGTLPNKANANRAGRLVTAITLAVGALALIGGIAEYTDKTPSSSPVDAILTILFGLACGVVGLRAKFGSARRAEVIVLAVILAALVITDTLLSSSFTHLFGLAVPAALLLLTTTAAPQHNQL